MKITKFSAGLLPAMAVTLLALGCQEGSDRPATFPVTGTVTQAGAAVAGATVSFAPSGDGQTATGITDASGKYALSTFGGDDGALPGQYGVKINKFEGQAEEGTGGEESMDSDAYAAAQEGAGAEADSGEPKNLLPEKYNNPDTSGFSATVKEEANTFDFDLE